MRAFACAVVIASLAGCVAVPKGSEVVTLGLADLNGAAICCPTLATAAHSPLPMQKTKVQLDKTKQAFSFGGTKAFFVLYELPAYKQTYSLTVNSVPQGTVGDISLVVPRLAFYDADFKLTRLFDEKTLRHRGNSVERTVYLNPQDAAEKYVAIFASDLSASIERAYSEVVVNTIAAGPMMFNIYSGRDGKSTLRSSPVGGLDIETQGLAAPAAAK